MTPDESNQLSRLQTCLKDIKTWMTCNFLLLNSDKTEVIFLGPKHLRDTLSNDIAIMDGINLASSNTVRNLGVMLDQDLSFNANIKQISKNAFFTCEILQKSDTYCLKKIQKNESMRLSLPGWITAVPHYQAAQTILLRFSIWSKMLLHMFLQEPGEEITFLQYWLLCTSCK